MPRYEVFVCAILNMCYRIFVYAILLSFLANIATELHNCNEAVCASLVSKCMLIKSCGCNMQANCTCCKDCYKCLQNLYTECCSCVGMCPESIGEEAKRSLKSSIEDLNDIIPGLFDVLTEEADHLNRWTVYSYNRFEDLDFLTPDWEKYKHILGMEPVIDPIGDELLTSNQKVPIKEMVKDSISGQNCTVLYMYDCMSLHKCRMTCNSMGASKYRWFHDGCCECVGHTCLSMNRIWRFHPCVGIYRLLECDKELYLDHFEEPFPSKNRAIDEMNKINFCEPRFSFALILKIDMLYDFLFMLVNSYGKNVSKCSNCPKTTALEHDFKNSGDLISDEL